MYNMTLLRSLSGKQVPTSHSHRGFSPVIQAAKPSRGTVSTVFLGGAQLARDFKLLVLMNFRGKVFSQECASAVKETVKTVHWFLSAPRSPS